MKLKYGFLFFILFVLLVNRLNGQDIETVVQAGHYGAVTAVLDKHYSDMDQFLYAPDDLFVNGYLTTNNTKNGMLDFDFEHKVELKVKDLIRTYVTVSE
jgi:hypothetical protein